MAEKSVGLRDVVQLAQGNESSLAMMRAEADLIPDNVNLFIANHVSRILF